jgi:hypothetical protein
MLAYVFWHRRSPEIDQGVYEEALGAFHRALGGEAPNGFLRSIAFRVTQLPFGNPAPLPAGYEDWYLVEDWRALGILNEAAVSGAIRGPHDRVAALSEAGVGAIYSLLRGQGALDEVSRVTWLSKPRDLSYDQFRASLLALPWGAELWERQMVLGPAPEFCVLSATDVELPYEPDSVDDRSAVRLVR